MNTFNRNRPSTFLEFHDQCLSLFLLGICLVVMMASGCNKKAAPVDEVVEQQIDIPDPMVLFVVGDPGLGKRVARQWSARRDGELTIIDQTVAEFEQQDYELPDEVDVIVYPPEMLGELVHRDRLREIPNDFLNSDEYNKIGLLRYFRTSVVRHQNESWAVPLGGPNFSMLIHRAFVESIDPPETWEQMDRFLLKVAEEINSNQQLGNLEAKVDMPLAKGWAAQTLLARVAPAICFRGKLSTVFDRSTIEPLIANPPFVEALEQLIAISSARSSELDPEAVFELAISGQSGLALSWPALGFNRVEPSRDSGNDTDSGLENETDRLESLQSRLRIIPLPGMERWYDQKAETWISRGKEDDRRVDLIGFSGLVASVTSRCPNERTAWDFLQWLPSKSISKLIMVESPSVGPFRASHLGDMSRWTGTAISEDVAFEYGDVIQANHERKLILKFPRIPGYRRYVESLDNAVRFAISGQKTAEEALSEAAKEWNEITESFGRSEQIGELKKETGL